LASALLHGKWRGAGEAILIISSTSDGGEENAPTVLRTCK